MKQFSGHSFKAFINVDQSVTLVLNGGVAIHKEFDQIGDFQNLEIPGKTVFLEWIKDEHQLYAIGKLLEKSNLEYYLGNMHYTVKMDGESIHISPDDVILGTKRKSGNVLELVEALIENPCKFLFKFNYGDSMFERGNKNLLKNQLGIIKVEMIFHDDMVDYILDGRKYENLKWKDLRTGDHLEAIDYTIGLTGDDLIKYHDQVIDFIKANFSYFVESCETTIGHLSNGNLSIHTELKFNVHGKVKYASIEINENYCPVYTIEGKDTHNAIDFLNKIAETVEILPKLGYIII